MMFKITEKLEYNATLGRYEVGLEAVSNKHWSRNHLLWQHAYAESMEEARSLAYLALSARINELQENLQDE